MIKDTGGPAFPHTVEYKGADCGGVVPHGGMTLRDYFAAKAMQPLISNFLARELNEVDPNGWMEGLAMDAYAMADAMLKARTT